MENNCKNNKNLPLNLKSAIFYLLSKTSLNFTQGFVCLKWVALVKHLNTFYKIWNEYLYLKEKETNIINVKCTPTETLLAISNQCERVCPFLQFRSHRWLLLAPLNNLLPVLRQLALIKFSGLHTNPGPCKGGGFLRKKFLLMQKWNAKKWYA